MSSTFKVMFLFILFLGFAGYYHIYSPKDLLEGELVYIEGFIDEYDVQLQLRDELVNKVRNDELWDSEKIEVIEEIKDASYEFSFEHESNSRPYRFDDGSFLVINTRIKETIDLDGSPRARDEIGKYLTSEDLVDEYADKGVIQVMEVELIMGLTNTRFDVTYGLFDGAWIGEMIFSIDEVEVSGFGSFKELEYGIIKDEEDVLNNRFAKTYVT